MALKLYRVTFDVPHNVYVLGEDRRTAEREARAWIDEVDTCVSLADASDLDHDELTQEEREASPAGDPYGLSLDEWAKGVVEVPWPWPAENTFPARAEPRCDGVGPAVIVRILERSYVHRQRRVGHRYRLDLGDGMGDPLWFMKDGVPYLLTSNGHAALLRPLDAPPVPGKRAVGFEAVLRRQPGPSGYISVRELGRLLVARSPVLVATPDGVPLGIETSESSIVFDQHPDSGMALHLVALVVAAMARHHGDSVVEVSSRPLDLSGDQLPQYFFRGESGNVSEAWWTTIAPMRIYDGLAPEKVCTLPLHETAAAAAAAGEAL